MSTSSSDESSSVIYSSDESSSVIYSTCSSDDTSDEDDTSRDYSSGDDDDSTRGSQSIFVQLFRAVEMGELGVLRQILSLRDKDGDLAVMNDDIHEALVVGARAGTVAACRLLWTSLGRYGKQIYFNATIDMFGPLQTALTHGQIEVVHLFIKELNWNIHQRDDAGNTPLCFAVGRLETARLLLENGANVNQGGPHGPLWFAVGHNNVEVCRLLLVEFQADPNLNHRPANQNPNYRNTDLAIRNGNVEILRMLLAHGAYIGHIIVGVEGTSLYILLRNHEKSLTTKVAITRVLVDHAKEDQATAAFMQATLESSTKQPNTIEGCCQIMLNAGIDPKTCLHSAIRANNLSICQSLVLEYQVDPFLQQQGENDGSDETTASSPFLAAARLVDTTLFEFLLGLWNERFASTGGKNGDGDYPLHVVCCDPHVSIQAIKALVNHNADALETAVGEQGILPFHFAVNWGASLDVIFYLLQHYPSALLHVGNAAIDQCRLASIAGNTNDLTAVEESFESTGTTNEDVNACGHVKKKAKTKHSG